MAHLRRSFPLVFHTASTLSGSLRSPPSPRGEGFVSRKAVSSYHSLPHWGRGTAQRRSGALVNDALETIFPALFHTARTLSGSLRSPPSPRGEGFVRRYSFSTYACIRFEDAGIAASSYRSLPHWVSFAGENGILVSSSIPHKNGRLLRAAVFMCITCLGKR